MIQIRRQRTLAPQSPRVSAEFAPGLISVMARPNGSSAAPQNLLGGPSYLGAASGSPSMEMRASPYAGECVGTFNSAAGHVASAAALNDIFSASGQATILAVLRANAADGSGDAGPFSLRSYAAENQHYPYTDGKIYLSPMCNPRYVSAVTPPTDVYSPHVIIATCRPNEQRFYWNGGLLATGTHTENPYINVSAGSHIGGNGALYLCAIWNRVLQPAEAFALGKNPWRLFATSVTRLFASAAASAAPTLISASAVNIGTTYATPRVTFSR